jgi:hypothetical protein
MINKSKLVVIAALLAVSVASPAFAQSFSKGDGTGNVLPFAYGPGGTKPAWTVAPQNEQVAAREHGRNSIAAVGTNGLHAYAAVPFATRSDVDSNAPAATGGGSFGYNQMLLID